jgi:hypothetical protein
LFILDRKRRNAGASARIVNPMHRYRRSLIETTRGNFPDRFVDSSAACDAPFAMSRVKENNRESGR